MATKKITPVNPDTKENDEAEAKDAAAERKTATFRIRASRPARRPAHGLMVVFPTGADDALDCGYLMVAMVIGWPAASCGPVSSSRWGSPTATPCLTKATGMALRSTWPPGSAPPPPRARCSPPRRRWTPRGTNGRSG
jgi:hypothetical protein